MSSRQTYNGFDNLTGRTLGTLKVGQLARRVPNVAWQAQCTHCGSNGVYTHQKLTTGPSCLNRGCGRNGLREELEQTPRKYREKMQSAERAKIEALEKTFNETTQKIHETVREYLLKGHDGGVYISPAMRSVSMTEDDAHTFNVEQAGLFVQRNPDYYPCSENVQILSGYLERNGLTAIVDEPTLTAAFRRLDEFGLMKHKPAAPQPVKANLEIEGPLKPPKPNEPEPLMGYDSRTGERREFSPYEVDRMSADQYRRTFRIYKDNLALPNQASF